MILDTDFLVQLLGGKENAHAKARELHENHEIQRVPVAVLSELEYGAEYALDEGTARTAGRLFARADKAAGGESGADMVDAMVAALAEVTGETVVTNNVSDFEALGVEVGPF